MTPDSPDPASQGTASADRPVLIVEDNAETAELERRALARAGYSPCIAGTVENAKALLQQQPFVAVLLDYNLPDGNAWEVVEIARACTPVVPAILVTAMGNELVAVDAIRHGVAEYVRKSDRFWEQLGATVDRVSRLARFDQELRHNNSLFEMIVDNATDIITILDARDTILYVSAAVQRVLGFTPKELIGTCFWDIVHPEDRGDGLPGQMARSADRQPALLRFHRSGGGTVPIEPTFQPVAEPQTARTIGVLRDVTERIALETRLRHVQKMDAVGQLTAGVAHDFNNLLQTLMGSLELLMDEVEDRPAAREYAEAALQSGQRGAQLTHHLLSFARKQILQPRDVDVGAFLAQLAGLLGRTLGPHIEVRVAVQPNLPALYVDPGQLETALLNLAVNARDAMPQGGRLQLQAFDGPGDGGDGTRPERVAVIAVTDTGSGIPPEMLDQVCEPFFTTKGVKGSGLGLSMVQGFARQSGGDLRIESVPGEGTSIELRLPFAHVPGRRAASRPQQRARGAGRILLVDDAPDVVMTVGAFLSGAGFEVRRATSGDEALAALVNEGSFDAMVTDYAMPGMNGAELAICARQIQAELPILVITGFAATPELEREMPAVHMMRKPFRRDALVGKLVGLIHPPGGPSQRA